MLRPATQRTVPARRGVILLVVVALLTLFAVVGLTFVLYAQSEAASARLAREAETPRRADVDVELLLACFLGQLLYDAADDAGGAASGLRGHGLARSVYGYGDGDNRHAFNGTGRLHGPSPFPGVDDFHLVNYTWFPADGFLRDPERLGTRRDPAAARRPFAGGFNAPYTYPDLNNLFLAAVRADGTVLTPSYHRDWTGFGSLDPNNPNWYDKDKPWLKYQVLRPRPADHTGFPPPEDGGGDVKNLIGGPGGNDSVWLDLNFPVLTAPDGRKFKPLFAPLIVDLDGRINVNVHGNIRGRDDDGRPAHAAHHGLGPWEVGLPHVLSRPGVNGAPEWPNLVAFRYGPGGTPATPGSAAATFLLAPHFYAPLDLDGCDETAGFRPTGPARLPAAVGDGPFPSFPAGNSNGSAAERANHSLLYNAPRPSGDDRAFAVSNLEALLRYGDTGSPALTSELFRLCPENFRDARVRRLVTTHSFDRRSPGAAPWIYDPLGSGYGGAAGAADQAPAGPPLPSPPLAARAAAPPPGSEFRPDWRSSLVRLERLNVNRPLPPFPHQRTGTLPPFGPPAVGPYDRFDTDAAADQFLDALSERQRLANDLYRALLTVTGVVPAADSLNPTDAELRPRRWLAQLAANVVDFVDDDDIQTPFNFYTELDAYPAGRPPGAPPFDVGAPPFDIGDPELPRYWVFGVELPHVVLNEVLAEYQEPDGATVGSTYDVRVWAELHNPFRVPPAGQGLQEHDGLPVPLRMPALDPGTSASASANAKAYAPYQVVVANRLLPRPGNDNVLGKPNEVRCATTDADFDGPVTTVGGKPATAAIDLQGGASGSAFFLLGPPGSDAHNALAAPPDGAVPAQTPLLQTANLRYTVTFGPGTPPARSPDDRDAGVAVLLRRLANPHIPFDPRPTIVGPEGDPVANPWYNPYVTVDFLDGVPLRNATDPAAAYASRGKRQPYAAHPGTVADQAGDGKTRHTFGRPNDPPPASGHYDWLVHLDRQLVNPMELLHVAGCQPHQLTQRFVTGTDAGQRFTHRAPWFDESRRLYRLFEFLEVPDRVERGEYPLGDRIPGKVNLNTVWDPETLLALCAPQPGDAFTADDVAAIFAQMQALRTPDGAPGPNDRPFRSLATGVVAPGDSQYPQGSGIEDTLLRSQGGGQRLFQPGVPAYAPLDDPRRHPWKQDELLTRLFGNVTTRSNVFAVWLTVGFFEVTDDTTRPVKLGAEIGRAEGRHVRHRVFAIVDRSVIPENPRPVPGFDPRKERAVLFFSVID